MNLPDWVKPGIQIGLFYGMNNPNNAIYHVRGIVDDQAVVMQWMKRKQYWHYSTLDSNDFKYKGDNMYRRKAPPTNWKSIRMTLHNRPEYNTPTMVAALKAAGMPTDIPSMLSDAFRLGMVAGRPGWKAERCAKCTCQYGGADCNRITTGPDLPKETS